MIEKFVLSINVMKLPMKSMKPTFRRTGNVRLKPTCKIFDKFLIFFLTYLLHSITNKADKELKSLDYQTRSISTPRRLFKVYTALTQSFPVATDVLLFCRDRLLTACMKLIYYESFHTITWHRSSGANHHSPRLMFHSIHTTCCDNFLSRTYT